jgi:hypothetical protein
MNFELLGERQTAEGKRQKKEVDRVERVDRVDKLTSCTVSRGCISPLHGKGRGRPAEKLTG